jgi:hypothetical protein
LRGPGLLVCAVLAIVLPGCALPRSSSTEAVASATMPPGIVPTEVQLSDQHWSTTANMHAIQDRGRVTGFRYTGTGQVALNEAATLSVPVTPGTIYVFSAHADDPSKSGEVDVLIDSADGKSTYVSSFAKAPIASDLGTRPWKAPPGVTRVLVGMQIAQSAVEKGRDLTFSRPVLRSATPANKP